MHHCGRFQSLGVTRREMLRSCACGFGSLAFGGLTADVLAKAGVLGGSSDIKIAALPANQSAIVPERNNIIKYDANASTITAVTTEADN